MSELLTFVKHFGSVLNESDTTALEKASYLDKFLFSLSNIISQKLNLKYKLINSKDKLSGDSFPNGSWSGLIGMLHRGEADIALGLSVTDDRFEAVDFSFPLSISRLTFITRKPEYSPEVMVFLKPFSPAVWVLFFVSLVLIIILLSIVLSKKYKVENIVINLCGAVLKQNNVVYPRNLIEFFLVTCFVFGITFLVYSYEAVLLSFMTFPTLSGVRTIPELATAVINGEYYCVSYPGASHTHALVKSDDSNSKIIGENLQNNKGTLNFQDVIVDKSVSKKPAFVADYNILSLFSEAYFISDDSFYFKNIAIAMKKEFRYKKQLNNIISHLWCSGILQKLRSDARRYEKYIAVSSAVEDTIDQSPRSLSLEDLRGIFYLLIIGHILSLIIFSFEVSVKKINFLF